MADTEIRPDATGPLVRLQITSSRLVWRIGPAWSVLAGALAAGAPLLGADALFRLAAAVILADMLWGALRQFAPERSGRALMPTMLPVALPYARPDAPLAGFLAGLGPQPEAMMGAAWHTLLLGLALIGAVSFLLGPLTVLLSASALVTLALMWGRAQQAGGRPLGEAILDVTLPWLLGASLGGLEALSWLVIALGAAFTVLQVGALLASARGAALAWIGQGAVVAVLIASRQLWALAGVAVLLSPPAWWLTARRVGASTYALPWWWAAMLLAALGSR